MGTLNKTSPFDNKCTVFSGKSHPSVISAEPSSPPSSAQDDPSPPQTPHSSSTAVDPHTLSHPPTTPSPPQTPAQSSTAAPSHTPSQSKTPLAQSLPE